MQAEPRWPDPAELLVHALEEALPVSAGIDTPPDLEGRLFLRVHVLGGRDTGATETTRVDVEAYAPVGEAHKLADDARRYLLFELAGTSPGGLGLVDTVRTEVRPRRMFYLNPHVERVVGTYSLDARLQ